MDHPSIDTHLALEQWIIDRHRLHLVHRRTAAGLRLVGPDSSSGLQIMHDAGILAGVSRARYHAIEPRGIALGEFARACIEVPVERLVEQNALCLLQTDPVYVVEEEQ